MKSLFAFLTLLVFLAPSFALASSPGLTEGPAGCTWNATVKKAGKSSISVHVDEQYGSCMDETCPIDAEGKNYTLTGKKYKAGEVIRIWVDLDKKGKDRATLNIPKCWTQTVMLPTAPENIAPSAGSVAVTSTHISDTSDFDPLDMPPVQAFPPPLVSRE